MQAWSVPHLDSAAANCVFLSRSGFFHRFCTNLEHDIISLPHVYTQNLSPWLCHYLTSLLGPFVGLGCPPPKASSKTGNEVARLVVDHDAGAAEFLLGCFFGVLCRPVAALSSSRRGLHSEDLKQKPAFFEILVETLLCPLLLWVVFSGPCRLGERLREGGIHGSSSSQEPMVWFGTNQIINGRLFFSLWFISVHISLSYLRKETLIGDWEILVTGIVRIETNDDDDNDNDFQYL